MRVSFANYPAGVAGTRYTIDKMRDMVRRGSVHPDIIQATTLIVKQVGHKDYAGEAEAIFSWVKGNIRYTRDPHGVELIQAPWITLKRGAGDCDDVSTLINAMCASIGMQTGFETIRCDPANPDDFSHVYAIIRTPAGWRAADPTVAAGHFGWRPSAGVLGRKLWV